MTTPYKEWYRKNKLAFNAARAERRRVDPGYRAKQQQYKKRVVWVRPKDGVPLAEVARLLGVNSRTLMGWRARALFPAPAVLKGRNWVHQYNVSLLEKLRDYLSQNPRTTKDNKAKLENLVGWVYVNWKALEIAHGVEGKESGSA